MGYYDFNPTKRLISFLTLKISIPKIPLSFNYLDKYSVPPIKRQFLPSN